MIIRIDLISKIEQLIKKYDFTKEEIALIWESAEYCRSIGLDQGKKEKYELMDEIIRHLIEVRGKYK